MNEPLNWLAIAAAWVWAWLGDRSLSLPGEVRCNCTCEVQSVACHQVGWFGELLKLLTYLVLGFVVGAGYFVKLVRTGISWWSSTASSPGSTPTAGLATPLTAPLAPLTLEGDGQDLRDRARQQLEAIRARRPGRA